MPLPIENPEDTKLVTLARATMARTQTSEGAAVRDLDGRTYAAARVALPSFEIDALTLAVAMAVSSGAGGLEAAAVCTTHGADVLLDLEVVREAGGIDIPVFVADPSGAVLEVRTS